MPSFCVKSNESLTMCGIKDKTGSIIQCKISEIPLVWKTGPATIGRPSILGISFTPTPPQNIPDLEYDLYHFSRKLRLTYHFRNSDFRDVSHVKMPSSFTPPPNEHQELENICKQIEHTPINISKSKDNLINLRKGLEFLLKKINTNKKIIKPADIGSIIVVMTPKDYWKMCYRHLADTKFYNKLDNNDPSTIVQERLNKFAEKHKSVLTNEEYELLTKRCHKISNLYMLPNLHKSKKINEIIEIKRTEYIQIDEDTLIEGRPTVAGPIFHTSGISEVLHCTMEPVLSLTPHNIKDSFDFMQRLDKQYQNNTLLSTCDIKPLYTNIRHNLFFTATEYWIEHLQNNLPLLQRFNKQFALEGLSIILKFNCFYINKSFFYQIKGTRKGAKFAVVASNLVVAYKEIQLFALLSQIYPQGFVDFILRNYVRFLDGIDF